MRYNQGRYILSEQSEHKYIGRNKDNIIFRSGWERAFMHYLSNAAGVIAWSSEEIIIQYKNPLKNRISRYFMDFFVRVKDKKGNIKQILVEVKPFSQTQQPRMTTSKTGKKTSKRMKSFQYAIETYTVNMAKWEATVEFCKKNELDFFLLTDDPHKQGSVKFKLWHWSELLSFV